MCQEKRCTLSECDQKKGEQLVISDGKCCPECKNMQHTCQQDGQFFENEAVWNVSPCKTCHCKWGRITCTTRKCPSMHCSSGETLSQRPEECCPQCMVTRNSCLHNGSYHSDGSRWTPIPCTKCFCEDGRDHCFPIQCPAIVCPAGQIVLAEGECCPQCAVPTCEHKRQIFQEGQTWRRAPCELCQCIAGETICTEIQCQKNLTCPLGKSPWLIPGECCPQCMNVSGQCNQTFPPRNHLEVWQMERCQFCQCNAGKVQCQNASCPYLHCQKPMIRVHKENRCCPECIQSKGCYFNERMYESEDTWKPDPCSLCTCHNGQLTCYQQPNPICPQNTYRKATNNSCSGYCEPYKCASVCADCEGSKPYICTKCLNAKQYVFNGGCFDKCPAGYYGNSEKLCQKCHESCSSCSKGGPWYCIDCKSDLFYLNGKCVSRCPRGYHLKNWRCQACHRSCQTCSGPDMAQCLSCSLPGQLIFKGRCVDRCPPAMGVENNRCKACPKGCLKCSGVSNKCLICSKGAILHNGRCLLSCPDGFYTTSDGNHCILCHPTCLKCNGADDGNCLSCHGGAQLKEGRCILPCNPGEYRTYDGKCESCHESCALCHLNPNGKDSACFHCNNKTEKPHGNTCIPFCGPSQYLQNGFCRDCAIGCLNCKTEDTCQRCQHSLILSRGKCVTHCFNSEYVHVDQGRVCKACPRGCSKCDDPFKCFACFDGMFLKNNMECVETCGLEYFSNTERRLCEANSFAPELRVVDKILINGTEEFGSLQEMVEVLDADTKEMELWIILVEPPHSGDIVLITDGKDVVLESKDSFSLGDMKSNRVIYVPGKEAEDSFSLQASDQQFKSPARTVQVLNLNNKQIKLLRNEVFIALAKQATVFNNNSVDFATDMNPKDVRLSLITGPFHGKLATEFHKDLKVFTLKELRENAIYYHHKISEATKDSFVLQGYDGYNVLNVVVRIHIRSKRSQQPVLVTNKMVRVQRGEMVKISPDILEALHGDLQKNKHSEIVYKLVPSHNNPKFGKLLMIVPALHHGPQTKQKGWKMIDPNRMALPLDHFYQRDINEGRIWYKHETMQNNTSDKFNFEVSDTCNPPHILSHQECLISVFDSTEPGSNPEEENVKVESTERALVPVVEQIFVRANRSVTLTNSSLSIIGADQRPSEVIFRIDQPPSHGFLKKKQVYGDLPFEAEIIGRKDSFTYKDLLSSLILYEHRGDEESTDSFTLNVTKGSFFQRVAVSVIIGLVLEEPPRIIRNEILQINKGSKVTITESLLRSSDVDTADSKLIYKLIQAPGSGNLQLNKNGVLQQITTNKPFNIFSQTNINEGHLEYSDNGDGYSGIDKFKFSVSDPQGNEISDQYFFINILNVQYKPIIEINKELVVPEGGSAILTKAVLLSSDAGVNDAAFLKYIVDKQPRLGHIEFITSPGHPVPTFNQSDVNANRIRYVHTSSEETLFDGFVFTLSDGQNEVVGKFRIKIRPVDDSISLIINNGLRVQEGIKKIITEFDLKAIIKDSKPDRVVFQVVHPTWHGILQYKTEGTHHYEEANSFTMEDIYKRRVTYLHNGTTALTDHFKFTVWDAKSFMFSKQDKTRKISSPSSGPFEFLIEILPSGKKLPILERNLGLQFLENTDDDGVIGVISEEELKASDPRGNDKNLTYVVTASPKHGRLQKDEDSKSSLLSFTQDDLNKGRISYVLTGSSLVFEDRFVFDLINGRSDILRENLFHILWSILRFEEPSLSLEETGHIARIPIVRTGNLKQFSFVTCVTRPGSATSIKSGLHQGNYDFIQQSIKIQFDEWEERKECLIPINDDTVFEGQETFYVELRTSSHAIISQPSKVAVTIDDPEDEPVIEFIKERFHVNETDGYLMARLKRKGDLSQAVSVVCATQSLTATGNSGIHLKTGSDFVAREKTNRYRVAFPQDLAETFCPVKIIDDSLYETAEYFQLILSDPSQGARLGLIDKAIATIDGPNDESLISFDQSMYTFNESSGNVEIEIIRSGLDQTHWSMVWCATRLSSPLSALPQRDYVPMADQITFRPGQTTQKCRLSILDDKVQPEIEGPKTFEIFLSSAIGSHLHPPFSAIVLITDIVEDVAHLQFERNHYEVDEKDSSISISIIRSGDLRFKFSVICHTLPATAMPARDFNERNQRHSHSVITFYPGETKKNCTVFLKDDKKFQEEEMFYLMLTSSSSADQGFPSVIIGERNNATVVITNFDGVPRLQFKESAYSVAEPPKDHLINTVTVQIVRTGDISHSSRVRCTTRDISAVAGLDYKAKSQILHFKPSVRRRHFSVDILHNSDTEWPETFLIQLDSRGLFRAKLGDIHSTTVTILDNKDSKDLVFPLPPTVVSLLYYDDIQKGLDNPPKPGYPLVCVTSCDSHHPSYKTTHRLCKEAGINASQVTFKWEVAYPKQTSTNEDFVELTDNTPFTTVTGILLDSIYFRSQFRIRCSAAPINGQGKPGGSLQSNIVQIDHTNTICDSAMFPGLPFSYEAPSFITSLKYTPITDPAHPNTVEISVSIPHQDGMLPLISTTPLNNVKYFLSDEFYGRHHLCSNLINPKEEFGFLNDDQNRNINNSVSLFPYEFDIKLRTNQTVQLYRHLNLEHCTWTYKAWFHMSDLVNRCGGKILTNFKMADVTQSFLTVRVPLYVSYLFASGPLGWSSLEHHTEMDFSFFYPTILWKTGLVGDGQFAAQLQVLRIVIDQNGHLIIDFRTQAEFKGLYILKDPTDASVKSQLSPPKGMSISFDLALVWSELTFENPDQLWRATSQLSHKDYIGEYTIELVPCMVNLTQKYVETQALMKCKTHKPHRFQLPIAFEQSKRPVPMEYSLNTEFQLTNNKDLFLHSLDPGSMENYGDFSEKLDYDGAFSKGQKIYGRILWNPEQDLSTAYKLTINKVFLCMGKDGFIPTFDPTGKAYKEGKQFGCIEPNSNLKHQFLILDRDHKDKLKIKIPQTEFEAQFVDEISSYSRLKEIPGVDAFEMSVDPLYKIHSGHQWFLQVLYVIGPADGSRRTPRSIISTIHKNGTNIRMLRLEENSVSSQGTDFLTTVVPGVALFILLLSILAFIFLRRHLKRMSYEL